jgi:hypothetical protein
MKLIGKWILLGLSIVLLTSQLQGMPLSVVEASLTPEPVLNADSEYMSDRVIIKLEESTGGFSLFSFFSNDYFDPSDFNLVSLDKIVIKEEEPRQSGFFSMFSSTKLQTWYSAKLDDNTSVEEALEALRNHPKVLIAEPDYIYKTAQVGLPDETTDPNVGQQWYLENINAPQAWEHLQSLDLPFGGSRDIIVAVIDTGVDFNHVDLNANMWVNSREILGNGQDDDGNGVIDDYYGYNAVYENGNPMDDHGHGTHVAGIIAMAYNNQLGGVGVASNVQIMAIKAANASGFLTASNIAKGINYAVTHGADVINMSFGSSNNSTIVREALINAYPYAVLVAAAGNDGMPNQPCPISGLPIYPASYDWVIGVMAHDTRNIRAPFSNFDCIPMNSIEYEMSAPGVGIYSTITNNRYATWSGTSMAAPVVSAIAALVKTKFPEMPNTFIASQVKDVNQGIANANRSVTEEIKPFVALSEYYFFDNLNLDSANNQDGIIDSGETFDIGLVLFNRKGVARDVRVEIDNNQDGGMIDPAIEVLIREANFENIGTLNKSDNILYENGVAKSVRVPLRIKVKSDTPNDYQIRLNFNAFSKSLTDDSETVNTFHIEFYVRNGVILPQIIDSDMILTNEKLWIIDKPTVVTENAKVIVEPGTTVQFFSSDSKYVYSTGSYPYLIVHGQWISHGQLDNMIQYTISEPFRHLVTSAIIISSKRMKSNWDNILDSRYISPLGYTSFEYSEILNPRVDLNNVNRSRFSNETKFDSAQVFVEDLNESIIDLKGFWNNGFQVFNQTGNVYTSDGRGVLLRGQNNLSLNSFGNKLSNSFRIFDNFYYQFIEPTLINEHYYSLLHFRVADFKSIDLLNSILSEYGAELINFEDSNELDSIHNYNSYLINNIDSYIQTYSLDTEFRNSYDDLKYFLNSQDRFIGFVRIVNNQILSWCDGTEFSIGSFPDDVIIFGNINEYENDLCAGLYYGRNNTYVNKLVVSSNFSRTNNFQTAFVKIPKDGISSLSKNLTNDEKLQMYINAARNVSGNNVVLNRWFDLSTNKWIKLWTDPMNSMLKAAKTTDHYSGYIFSKPHDLLPYAIYDFYDDPTYSILKYYTDQDYPEEVWPFVTDVKFFDKDGLETNEFGVEEVRIRVSFNRAMNTVKQPTVQFGGSIPFGTSSFIGNWINERTWEGTFNVLPYVFDGYQYMSIYGGEALNDPWKVSQLDDERYRFKVNTSKTNATFLQASGEENQVRLQWVQDDFDLLAGYNIYRSDSIDGTYTKLNTTIIPDFQKEYVDTNVNPGQTYYYAFTVVQTDFSESQYSNIASATPIDNVPPIISHTPITSASPNLSLTLSATVTDNIAVQSVTLYYKSILSPAWSSKAMIHAGSNVYRASIESSVMTAPGVLYYIQASDGVSIARSGSASVPHTITITDAPIITSVTPATGNTIRGDEVVDIIGTNFKAGASVLFNNSPASEVTWISSTRLRVTTPQHAPSIVDIKVTQSRWISFCAYQKPLPLFQLEVKSVYQTLKAI